MAQMMDDPKVAAEIIANGQLSEFTAAYAKATDERGEMADLIRQSVQAAMVGQGEITSKVKETVKDTLDAMLKEHGVNRPQLGDPALNARNSAAFNPLAPGAKMDGLGYANIGDFARSVFNKGARDDERRAKAEEVMNAYSSYDPSTGGFLVPETFRSEIYDTVLEQSIIRPRASVISMDSDKLSIPFVDETTHSGSVFGGMTFAWTPESGTISPSEAKFGRVKLEANKLTGLARVPNELWAAPSGLSTFLNSALPRGISYTEDVAFITGTGVGQPLGFTNSPAKITITKETNQTAATIVTDNILKMYARLLPQSIGNSVVLANPTTFPQLMTLSIPVGTGGSAVSLVDITSSPTMTLLGRPLILTEKVPALGAAGDIGFYDLSFYLIGDRQAVSLESSEHSRFANDETELRAILRVDGRPWIQSAITPLNGDSLSPFVVLGARA